MVGKCWECISIEIVCINILILGIGFINNVLVKWVVNVYCKMGIMEMNDVFSVFVVILWVIEFVYLFIIWIGDSFFFYV